MTGPVVNPIIPPTLLLRPTMPNVYLRNMIYDPTWNDPSYNSYIGQKIVPALGSLVKDTDGTPLWVIGITDTLVPVYTNVLLGDQNDNVVSLLNYGNSLLRLYVDNRAEPFPATVDSKCVFLGKSPRFYSLTRFEGTVNETVISQYFDSSGTFQSIYVPLIALDSTNTSWYLPRCNITTALDNNEEVVLKIYDESGAEVYSAKLFAKESAVINEEAIYAPKIVGMLIDGNQKLPNGNLFLYEKQDFDSIGLSVTLVYSDGTTNNVAVDGLKCIIYGKDDFISSFAGLEQTVTVKYFRSQDEVIDGALADLTGSMITRKVPITVIPNGFNTTAKISIIPYYHSGTARYIPRYFIYFTDGRPRVDITAYISIIAGTPNFTSTYFGQLQNYTVSVNMHTVDPGRYVSNAIYTQNIWITFYPPGNLVKYSIQDSEDADLIYGLDNSQSRRPVLKYDSSRQQYFIPSATFVNSQAFINSFYRKANPPYDPLGSEVPEEPTHFVVRDITTGAMLTAGVISVAAYASAFNMTESTAGYYNSNTVIVEFVKVVNSTTTKILYGVPVEVSSGTYVG